MYMECNIWTFHLCVILLHSNSHHYYITASGLYSLLIAKLFFAKIPSAFEMAMTTYS